jgi:DNA-binding MarR family transcriptional regulator
MIGVGYSRYVATDPMEPGHGAELGRDGLLGVRTAYRLIRLGERAKLAAKQVLAPLGLRPRHYDVLATLSGREPQSQLDMSRTLGIDPNVMVGLVDELEERGLARRQRNPDDRRRHALVITSEGIALLRDSAALLDAAEAAFFAAITTEERALLHRLVGQLLSADG